MSFSPDNAALWTHGTWSDAPLPTSFCGVSTDSRAITPGTLFVALRGASFDGHAFAAKALASGATAAIVQDGIPLPECPDSAPLLRVANPNQALADLAHGWRLASRATILGISGSAGKTTVKEMTATLLASQGETARTPGNFNNEIGLPLSLLAMPETARFGVFETGISHPGEMAPLASTLRPNMAILSCIAPVHLEAFGSLEAIANEKADLLRALPPDGIAILPLDDALFPVLQHACPCRIFTAALADPSADYFASEPDASSGSFLAHEKASGMTARIETHMPGLHNVRNALLAIAAARALGTPWEDIAPAFLGVQRPPMRWQVSSLAGITLINDAYNANPLSMEKALETLAALPTLGHHAALLGDMLELGAPDEAELHRRVGRAAAQASLFHLWLLGSRACQWIREGALQGGMPASRITACESPIEAAERIRNTLHPSDTLLLKASRGLHLEDVEQHLRTLPFPSDAIELVGLQATCILGILPEERTTPRHVLLDIRLEGNLVQPAASDNIADAVDYRAIANIALDTLRQSSDGLIECLAQRVAESVLTATPQANRIRIRITKPNPMPGLAASACEFALERDALTR